MNALRQLRTFRADELLFDNAQSRDILKFIFPPTQYAMVDALKDGDLLREFAQALLLEAVDASYAIGFVESLWRNTANPTKSMKSLITKLCKKAALHWFRHREATDITEMKVYQFVVNDLARSFKFVLAEMANGLALHAKHRFYVASDLARFARSRRKA